LEQKKVSFNPSVFVSEPNPWFEIQVTYKGICTAHFETPKGFIRGQATVYYDETGKCHAEIKIEEFELSTYDDMHTTDTDQLIWLVNGRRPQVEGNVTTYDTGLYPENACTSLKLYTEEGVFEAIGKIQHTQLSPLNEKIQFFFSHAEYRRHGTSSKVYWVFPLTNFVARSLHTGNSWQPHVLDQHPLRVFPTKSVPEDLSFEEHLSALSHANKDNFFIPFQFGNELGFVERLLDYEGIAGDLQQGRKSIAITSVAIGSATSQPLDFQTALEWLPLDFLHMLSLVNGSWVGLPWIEFRDDKCNVIGRIHTQRWQAPYSKGHIAIDELSDGGISLLLSGWQAALDSGLVMAIRLIVKGSQSIYGLEDQLAFLFRSADTLTKHLRTRTTIPTPVEIDDQLKALAKKIVQEAGRQIRKIAEEAEGIDKDELERISQVVSGAMNKSPKKPNGAHALMLLAGELGLMDFSVLPDENEWIQLYNKYRNQVIHESYFPDTYPRTEFVPLYYHLLDLLLRVVLQRLKYSGQYRKAIFPMRVNVHIDWVTETTSWNDLWYSPPWAGES
jgi:hypothetical protein